MSVKSFNKNHIRINAMLTNLANGKCLRPFIVFNCKPYGAKEIK